MFFWGRTLMILFPRPWRLVSRRRRLADEGLVRQSPPDDGAQRFHEAPAVAFRVAAFVEPERLLVQIPEEMKRLHADVGALDRPLHERPEVFKAVRMDAALHVRF